MIVLYLIESYGSYVPYIVEILWFLYKHRHSYGSYVSYTLQILM
jgi:hypothetical protein